MAAPRDGVCFPLYLYTVGNSRGKIHAAGALSFEKLLANADEIKSHSSRLSSYEMCRKMLTSLEGLSFFLDLLLKMYS